MSVDREQIIFALERAEKSLQLQADRVHQLHDCSAEYPFGDAKRMREAIAIIRAEPVTQVWIHGISMMQQSVLLAAIRGPDGLAKYGGGAKMLLRWFRRCILLSAMDGRVLADPIEPNGGSFTGPSLDGSDDLDPWYERMQVHVADYLRQVDALPHHFQMHFLHAAEILGYKHPVEQVRHFWLQLYLRLVNDFHLHAETELELDDRLGDTRAGWLKRADPATAS